MKNVITTVGLSLVENYRRYFNDHLEDLGLKDINTFYGRIIKKDKIRRNHNQTCGEFFNINPSDKDIMNFRVLLKNWICNIECTKINPNKKKGIQPEEEFNDEMVFNKTTEKRFLNQYASAEIQSLLKFFRVQNDNINVTLIATDSLLCCIVSQIVAEVLNGYKNGSDVITVAFNNKYDCINNLQIDDHQGFVSDGIKGLMNRCLEISSENSVDVYFNITGGYKGLIPITTLIGQLYKYKIFYIYENTENIIMIPNLSISFDNSVFEKNIETFQFLKEGRDIKKGELKAKYSDFSLGNHMDYLDCTGEKVSLNPLVAVLYNKFMENKKIYYIPDDVWQELQIKKPVMEFLKTVDRSTTIVPEETHKNVWYKQHHIERIYHFVEGKRTYIYKVFGNNKNARREHEEHVNYLRSVTFNDALKNNIINTAKPHLITNDRAK